MGRPSGPTAWNSCSVGFCSPAGSSRHWPDDVYMCGQGVEWGVACHIPACTPSLLEWCCDGLHVDRAVVIMYHRASSNSVQTCMHACSGGSSPRSEGRLSMKTCMWGRHAGASKGGWTSGGRTAASVLPEPLIANLPHMDSLSPTARRAWPVLRGDVEFGLRERGEVRSIDPLSPLLLTVGRWDSMNLVWTQWLPWEFCRIRFWNAASTRRSQKYDSDPTWICEIAAYDPGRPIAKCSSSASVIFIYRTEPTTCRPSSRNF